MKIRIGWAAHEDLWVKAASTLPRGEKKQAYRDIASLTGRSWTAIECRAKKLRSWERDASRAFLREVLPRKPGPKPTAPFYSQRVAAE